MLRALNRIHLRRETLSVNAGSTGWSQSEFGSGDADVVDVETEVGTFLVHVAAFASSSFAPRLTYCDRSIATVDVDGTSP